MALGALFALAALEAAWNVLSLPPLIDYDAAGHAGYILTIVEEHRLPQPLEGWSTFHPPFYYVLGAALWSVIEPLDPGLLTSGLRALSVISWLYLGLAAFRVSRHLSVPPWIALLAVALTLFVPMNQTAGVFIGNEALAAALSAAALLPLLRLQSNPRDLGAAFATGVLTALALSTKYSALMLFCACPLPFLRRDLDRRAIGAFALLLATLLLLAGPIYMRNYRLTGSFMPMTRSLKIIEEIEKGWTPRPRHVLDYAKFSPSAFYNPTVHLPDERNGTGTRWNPALQSVWPLAYASIWGDPFSTRLPFQPATLAGRVLLVVGLFPTVLVLFGLSHATFQLFSRGGHSPDGPLVVMSLAGIAAFIMFTWKAPALVAVKGAYLLPLAVPAAVFFGKAVARFRKSSRKVALVVCAMAAAASLVLFTDRLVFRARPLSPQLVRLGHHVDEALPGARIGSAMNRLMER